MYRVFFVEDEIAVRSRIISQTDWAMERCELCGEADDGETALPLIIARRPDILLTDIKMPFMDGLELIRIVKRELPELVVVVLSGYDEFAYAQEAIRLGVSDYVLKPVTPAKLAKALGKAVEALDSRKDALRVRDTRRAQPVAPTSAAMAREQFEGIERERIASFLRMGEVGQIDAFSEAIAQEVLQNSGGSRMYLSYAVFDVLSTCAQTAREMGAMPIQIEPFDATMQGIADARDVAVLIARVFSQIMRERGFMADKGAQLAQAARAYIDQRYMDAELSLSVVARHVSVSPNYLSALLNRETTETFSDYLNRVRLKKAMILLKTTGLSAAEVALRVGYQNAHYFSKVFKKVVGITPREYRKL